ncbi:TylF/MycF/NovP-related O-methyltransferase [Bradyrhizobium sp. LHD-71]|uniref:TylF/MycF/NovP-related O-methyltransferase n=1 Tax=Bradyrhizobium sp. LHD-71 TaxID=3072141 RepID=UPI00280FD4C4|nr:TylF/MycF/NovP-related O-methyltransferase [Bradyrhizobium sp. LHD-71]MDQ8728053.1 TylF/MycF/NovP-related O-methyltransferase [Bradyrhizobium sp. LHD-71]
MSYKDTPLFKGAKKQVRQVSRRVVGWHEAFSHENARRLQAALEGADYAEKHMKGALASSCKEEVLLHSLAHAPKEGLVLEFGVWSGATINVIADNVGRSRAVHGFDSFEGLPEDWFGMYRKGTFHTGGKLPHVRSNVTLHKGWFQDTLPTFARNHNEKIAFLHVDCDLYSSTKTIFDVLGDRLGPGAVILFDEYFNYPGWREHEYKAFQEFVASRSLKYRYLVYNTQELNASVQILSPGLSTPLSDVA